MARRRLTLKRIDPWSALKFGFVANLSLLAIFLLGFGVVWFFVRQLGLVEKVCEVARTVGFVRCGINGVNLFRSLLLLGSLGVVVQTGLVVFAAFLYNLIADLAGGLTFTFRDDSPSQRWQATGPARATRQGPDRPRRTAGAGTGVAGGPVGGSGPVAPPAAPPGAATRGGRASPAREPRSPVRGGVPGSGGGARPGGPQGLSSGAPPAVERGGGDRGRRSGRPIPGAWPEPRRAPEGGTGSSGAGPARGSVGGPAGREGRPGPGGEDRRDGPDDPDVEEDAGSPPDEEGPEEPVYDDLFGSRRPPQG